MQICTFVVQPPSSCPRAACTFIPARILCPLCPKPGCGVEGFGCLESTSSRLPMVGGQSSWVTRLEQEPDAWWLSPVLSQEGRTQAGKGEQFAPGWARCRQRSPKPPASTWARPFGQEMEDRAWRKGFDFGDCRGGEGQGTGRSSLLCVVEVIAEV